MTNRDYIASVHDIFAAAITDPELKSCLNINEILQKNDDIQRNPKSLEKITYEVLTEIKDIVIMSNLSSTERNQYIKDIYVKLKEYRVINEIFEIHRGKHIRWIRRTTGRPCLTIGGIVIDIKFLDTTGTHILVKCGRNQFIQIKYDDCVIFQRLSDEEQIILAADAALS